jgi:hypothetical protein
MPAKSNKPTSDELLAQFDDLGVDTDVQPISKPATTAQEHDILAELDNLASQRPNCRSGAPRLSTEARGPTKSPNSTSAASPSTGPPSEEKGTAIRISDESGRSSRVAGDVELPEAEKKEGRGIQSAGGGWWGGLLSTATAAMKQAEAAVKEIQRTEEAQKWAEQVRGNVGALRDLGNIPLSRCADYRS